MEKRPVDFLIVDDSHDAADSLAILLGAMGHETDVAYSGMEALAKVHLIQPICVLLDISMPEMDGLDLARQIRQEYGDNVVLIAVTGFSTDHPRVEKALEIVDYYFSKPVTLADLQRVLTK